MQVRAKFKVDSTEKTVMGVTVKMSPVTTGSDENKSFFKWTPYGELRMGVVNVDIADSFVPGTEFYVDFIPAEVK